MAQGEQGKDPEGPRVIKINRRRFFGRSLPTVAAGAAAAGAISSGQSTAKSKRERKERTLDRYRLFIEQRAFKYPVAEIYPSLDGPEPRVIATSTDGWLGIWKLDEPGRPVFKGKRRDADDIQLARSERPFRRLPAGVAAGSESGRVVAWYERRGRRVEIEHQDGRKLSVRLPEERGHVVAIGLGGDGSSLGVAMELGGVLLFDVAEAVGTLIGELFDSDIGINHICEPEDPCSSWNALPCACDVVHADVRSQEGSVVSTYDRQTGRVSTTVLPCGSGIPVNAICVCNCVSVPIFKISATICTCNLVCTCDTVATSTGGYTYTYWYPN